MVTEEAKVLNEAIFTSLAERDPDKERRAADAVNMFTRSLMYHKFTGMPKRGFMCRIMPPVAIKTKQEWLALGYPERDLEKFVGMTYRDPFAPVVAELSVEYWKPWWDDGSLFYEIVENRLAREDYERRYLARQVPRWEWRMREQSRRKSERYYRQNPTARHDRSREIEDFAYAVMGDLASQILAVANTKEPG